MPPSVVPGGGDRRTLGAVDRPETPDDLAGALQRLLSSLEPGSGWPGGAPPDAAPPGSAPRATPTVDVEHLHQLSAGASRETWSFDAVSAGASGDQPDRRALILQRVRPGISMDGPSPATEDALISAATQAGVPVPAVVADASTCEPHLGSGRISAHVEGETLGTRIVGDQRFASARRVLVAQCGEALAGIHSIDPASVPGLAHVDTLGRLRDGLDALDEARPAFELALRWLHHHQPPPGRLSVVHGDFRVGNLIVDEHSLAAVLDWELAHLGDPLEDLGWLCVRAWRFGGEGEVGGIGSLDELIDAYQAASGRPVEPASVRWWIAAGTLTWGLICAVQARRHLDGHVRSVELATIGRRVCETEYDLLQLLHPGAAGRGATGQAPPSEAAASQASALEPPGFHGRPTAAELVAAVRGHLHDEVASHLSGADAYHLKVGINALRIVERELLLGATVDSAASQALGCAWLRGRTGPGHRHRLGRRRRKPRGDRGGPSAGRRPPPGSQPPLAPGRRPALTDGAGSPDRPPSGPTRQAEPVPAKGQVPPSR